MNTNQINKRGNFDDVNISSVESMIEKERNDKFRDKKAFTMLQDNSPCEVTITQSSREKCAKALLK